MTSTEIAAFTGIETVLPELVVATSTGTRFHRPSIVDETRPACGASSRSWDLVEPEQARRAELTPCSACWGPILEYLALDESSPVGYAGEDRGAALEVDVADVPGDSRVAADGTGELFEPPDRERVAIASLTDEVLVLPSSPTKKFHAPADDSSTLCGLRGNYRPKPREVLRGHFDPCRDCFDVEGES